jgi:hypothetical protein
MEVKPATESLVLPPVRHDLPESLRTPNSRGVPILYDPQIKLGRSQHRPRPGKAIPGETFGKIHRDAKRGEALVKPLGPYNSRSAG